MADVAVVITCRDGGRTVSETVARVLAQTRPAAEVVVVDNGSTDPYTRQRLRTAGWPGVTILDATDGGLSAARNVGIRATSAAFLVTLDAGDVLDPSYLERTAAVLERDESVSFVTTAIHRFGEADRIWTPQCDLVAALTRGTGLPVALFRRHVWEELGGFDENASIRSVEDQDFWISTMGRGFRGRVLPDALAGCRPTHVSMPRRNVQPGAHLRAIEALFTKHQAVIERLGVDVVAAKEACLRDLQDTGRRLSSRQQQLQREADVLDRRIQQAARKLRAAGRDTIEWGDLRRLTPLSQVWGLDRGTPLDRYYIERFLERNRADIRGAVLEMKDPGYTRAFGVSVTRSDVLDINPANPQATIVADLTQAEDIPADSFDCFILTQTLQFIFDTKRALAQSCRVLKPGGVLLCTVPAAGRISCEDEGVDGDYWRFTEASVRRLFAEVFPLENYEVGVCGNVLACAAFLYGLSQDELRREELDQTDPYFPLIITVRAVKAGGGQRRAAVRNGALSSAANGGGGAILLYHRVPASPDDDPGVIDARHFRSQMEHLRREYHPIALQELANAASGGTIPLHAVAVTLDDGGLDTLEVVSPIASELGIPLTVFLNTERLDEEHERWWDLLARILLGGSAVPESLSARLRGEPRRFGTATASGRQIAHDALRNALIDSTLEERTELMQRLVDWSGLDLTPRRSHRALMSQEIRDLAAAGHDIGAHTVHHLSLSAQSRDVQMAEIVRSREVLEQLLHRPVSAFAYPYGRHTDESVSLVRAAGFSMAVVIDPRPVLPGADRFRLPRLEVKHGDVASLARSLGPVRK